MTEFLGEVTLLGSLVFLESPDLDQTPISWGFPYWDTVVYSFTHTIPDVYDFLSSHEHNGVNVCTL